MDRQLAGVSAVVIGGDERELFLVAELIKQGADVTVVGFPLMPALEGARIADNVCQALQNVDVVILPMPGIDSSGQVKSLYAEKPLVISDKDLSQLKPGTLLLVGVAKQILKDITQRHQLKLIETADLDDIAIFNSVPTAEGAIQIAMEKLPVTIHGSKTLVLGYGRCGATLAGLLQVLNAKVFVAARKQSDLARAYVQGLNIVTYKNLSQYLSEFDLIFNTVPQLVLDYSRIAMLNCDCLIIDIAAAPGGVNFSAAEELGIKAILASGLPGKVAPKTAGKILAAIYPGLILREIDKNFRRCIDDDARG